MKKKSEHLVLFERVGDCSFSSLQQYDEIRFVLGQHA